MKRLLNKIIDKVINRLYQRLNGEFNRIEKISSGEQTSQLIIKNQYRKLSKEEIKNYTFEEVGFRKYSQNDEDGILLFIFSVIGTTNKTVVEICASDGIECNAANLIINHGWNAFLFDANFKAINKGTSFYKSHPNTFTLPPKFVHAWVTRGNINNLFIENEISGEVDLLSIDLDGVDYWIWEAIETIRPRLVVAEIQCILGKDDSLTVPYADNFSTKFVNGFGIYSGASLKAFIRLAERKGYRLIGVEKYGFNAFFLRNDVGTEFFPAYDTQKYEDIPFVKWAREEFLDLVKDLEWEKV